MVCARLERFSLQLFVRLRIILAIYFNPELLGSASPVSSLTNSIFGQIFGQISFFISDPKCPAGIVQQKGDQIT